MNKVIEIGRLTKDPEIRFTQSNIAVCNFTIAVNKKDGVNFFDCVVWREQASNLVKYQSKGSLIGIFGELDTNEYVKGGKTIKQVFINVFEIDYLDSKKKEEKND